MINRLAVSPAAEEMFRRLKDKHWTERLAVLIDDTGCCSPSNVFVTKSPQIDLSTWRELGIVLDIPIFVNRRFESPITKDEQILIDIIDSPADDSFSLETTYERRFVMRYQAQPKKAYVNPTKNLQSEFSNAK